MHMDNCMEPVSSSISAKVSGLVATFGEKLTPSAVKALGRLVNAGVDVPIAWLEQRKAAIDAKTQSLQLVESAIGQAAAARVGSDPELAERAATALLGKEYRRQTNREAVATAMIDELAHESDQGMATEPEERANELDDTWLNVFERYAEDASSADMQKLWGKVIAGQIKRPGKYSIRTLRFLSEVSQQDAILFERVAKHSFGKQIPKSLAVPDNGDISHLMTLEAAGLISNSTGVGVQLNLTCNDNGISFCVDGEIAVVYKSSSSKNISIPVISLTPLGVELLPLISQRDMLAVAKSFALATRIPEMKEAYVGVRVPGTDNFSLVDTIWKTPS